VIRMNDAMRSRVRALRRWVAGSMWYLGGLGGRSG